MRLQDIPEDIEPRVGDILEIEQGDVCFEVRIIGITADGYLCEQDNVEGAVLLEGVDLDKQDVGEIASYIADEKRRIKLGESCWTGYKQEGMKKKGNRMVPNCVPEGQEAVEESGLQYYTGVKKHGEKYMKLAAKAGREGASQEELGRLRDRYSKAEKTKESIEQDVAESTEQSLQKKIQAKRDALGLAREQRRARGQHQQGQREIKLQAEIDKLSNQLTQMKKQDVAEAGPFSYGYKKPRKGSVAYWAEKKRKEQEKGKPPIEPKDQMVGVAKVTKAVSEGSDNNVYFEVDSEKAYNHIMKKFRSVINWDGDTMVAPQKYWGAIQELAYSAGGEAIEVGNEQGVAEGQQDLAKPITYYSLVHKATNKVLSTHKDLESAKDEHRGMDQGERAHYRIAASTKAPKSFSMKEDAEGVAEDISSTKKKISKYEELALAANRAGDDAKCKQYQQKIQVLKQKMSQGVAEGYTGRETKDGTWRVFKDGQAVAVAGPFKSRDEAHAWIKKHKQGVSEAKSLKKRVRVVQGEHAGKTGWIREIKHGIHSTAPKRYYVDIDGGGQANNLPASALRLLKNQSDVQKGMAEATGDNKFDAMMGNIKKSAPVPVSGYVAVEYASENKSDRIKGVTLKGKPMPSSVDVDDLDGEIEFTPDEIERHLIKIGRDNGWSIIDPGHGRGYSELFFDTNANYTSDNQSILAKNIVNTVNQINKFFSGLNNSLQSTGLPGYRATVWQEISSPNGQKIGDINQIKQIALTKVVNSPNDPGELIGKAILRELPKAEEDGDGYTPEDFAYARKIAKIYITKGERAGLKAQLADRRMIHVSDLIDELLSHAGAQKYRTIKDLDEQGMAEGDHDDQFSLSGKMPATDRIPQDSTAGQDKVQAMVARMKQRTIDSILDIKPEWERSDLELMTAAELNQILRDIQSGEITEAEYQGRKVALGKPMAGDVKKSKVYVRKPNGKVVKVNFGDKTMKIKKSNPKRRKSFRARHNCKNPGPRWKARYWSCRAW